MINCWIDINGKETFEVYGCNFYNLVDATEYLKCYLKITERKKKLNNIIKMKV